jgi:hypothetical protein
MKTLNEIENILENHKKELAEKYHISEIGIFGSYVRNEQNEKSDVDILVEFNEPIGLFKYTEFENYLSDLIGKKVDITSKKYLKPVVCQEI